MKTGYSIVMIASVLAVSCAKDKHKESAATFKPLSQRLDESNGYKQGPDGSWVPKSDKRSSFEAQGRSQYFQGEYQKKAFKTNDYTTKSWWGNKDYGAKPYTGNTDGSRFEKASRLDGKGARESDHAADLPKDYKTGEYATNAARETEQGAIAKPYESQTDPGRRVDLKPEIIDWREQRKLSLEQSKGILGH